MAIRVDTSTPQGLLQAIKQHIDEGDITTWSYDQDGDFTHSVDQWRNKAWFKPSVLAGERLTFTIIAPTNTHMSGVVYGIYHGRFVEMLVTHFDSRFHSAVVTAMPADGDLVNTLPLGRR